MRFKVLVALAALLVPGLVACGSNVRADEGSSGADVLKVYVGVGDDREVLQFAVDNLLPDTVGVELIDADDESNGKVAAGDGDLSYYQHIPAFEADQEEHGYDNLSIVSKVNVVPYGLYSSKWKDLADTADWLNVDLIDDQVTGSSLPHGSKVVLPNTPTGFARGLYLLQSSGLTQLDRPFGGTEVQDLTVTEANVVDSLRHLSLLPLEYGEFIDGLYENYDAVVLTPKQAESIGLEPDKDALAVEPGPQNPYAHVLVAPSRLAGDERVLELTHALESPDVAEFLKQNFHGANIPAAVTDTN
ncbi:MetQ/NlpA family ABC transporter substrate-binding protein [Rhodococcoides kyotonense]|uniref:D-methionine transport system substrate-binding protein n=1 Tax=Rhodococcoides kyotonense TaxID=398843 RepID=A0A239H7I2_9NOCA|nr:MetQ/NlpA family ABC transporter substrate-binding protein [Rhodococcus kyotonensis]SNS77192.1 D-methionine transport system substrate-binding protein [Rhodococcus kyotonensis]